ncbi:MAG: type 1 glutamine amidotransferase [Acidobacteria bacterium]|nr:type 1 glutamine amidotransferase [Acidobacteriota bacterium]
MRPWCLVQHVAWEGPGLLGVEARARGIELHVLRMDLGDPLPPASQIGGLVVMGGPMGVADAAAYPHLAAEIDLLAVAVAARIPVLGVCLGSQLLASALGARVFKGPALEVGLGDVDLTEEGRLDPVMGPAGRALPVVHWHNDTFDLPEGSALLASSAGYANQAYRFGDRVYGLQFHIELDAEMRRAWAARLPPGATLDEMGHARAARAGRALIGRWFDRAVAVAGSTAEG